MPHKVLLVDDEPNVIKALTRTLDGEDYDILTAGSAEKALDILEKGRIDVVVSDEMMPGMSGTELLSLINKEFPNTVKILLTGHANLDTAEKALTQGKIFRFLAKPWNDVDLTITIRQALQLGKLTTENTLLNQEIKKQTSFLQQLEKKHPGITQITTDNDGTIVVEDMDEAESFLNTFLKENPSD